MQICSIGQMRMVLQACSALPDALRPFVASVSSRVSLFRSIEMNAYAVVKLTVKDPDAVNRYSAAAGPVVKQFGGEFISRGAWEIMSGEPAFANGAIIRFVNRETAIVGSR
jgi:hypothetical protein